MKYSFLILALIFSIFVQIWINLGGFTVRLEDIIVAIFFIAFIIKILEERHFIISNAPLHFALILFLITLVGGAVNATLSDFPNEVKKDSIVNSIRLVFSFSCFFIGYHYVKSSKLTHKTIVNTILSVTALTSFVCILQIFYWDNIIPIKLPEVLINLKDHANQKPGREIFGLYIGDTGSHKWSSMVAMQFVIVYFLLWYSKNQKLFTRILYALVLVVLIFILMRISVRNSIMGLLVTIPLYHLLSNLIINFKLLNLIRGLGIATVVIIGFYFIIMLLPEENFYVNRILSTIPQIDQDGIQINRATNIVGRLYYWYFAFELFLQKPIFGNGFYSYQYLSEKFSLFPTVHAHNSWLNYLAEFGLVGLMLLLTIFFVIGKEIKKIYIIRRSNMHYMILRSTVTTSFIYIIFTSFFSNALYSTPEIAFRFLLLGVVLSNFKDLKLINR